MNGVQTGVGVGSQKTAMEAGFKNRCQQGVEGFADTWGLAWTSGGESPLIHKLYFIAFFTHSGTLFTFKVQDQF